MKINYHLFFFVVLLLVNQTRTEAQVVINEYSCSNWALHADNYSEYEDWIELYNITSSPVNIGGYYLSDRLSQPTKWKFPAGTTIPPNSPIIVWASGRNESNGSIHHTNFRLTQTKLPSEVLVLSNTTGNVVSQVTIEVTKKHHSRGRNPNGGVGWSVYNSPSPGTPNLTASAKQRYAQAPVFDLTPGFYNSTQTITITTGENNATIYYTLDGTEPDPTSSVYTAPITIDSTTVLKAITISSSNAFNSSFITYATYFINEVHTLPVISIAADDLTTLANGSGSLIPEGTIEYFDINGILKTSGYGEFNRHGRDSWALDQRSVDFIMRDEFGYNYALQEQLFNLTHRDEFQRIILRAAGDDNYPAAHRTANAGSAHLRDAYVQNLAKTGGLNLDVRIGTKTIVYINGIYWGVYDIRDNPDDHDFTEYYYNQGKYDLQYLETWGNTWAEYGGQQAFTDWGNLFDYIMNSDMNNPAVWDSVTSQLDVYSLVDYIIVNSVTVCSDWLNYNTGWWRGLNPAGGHKKWGYILWDNDAVFGFYINYTGIPDKTANALPCHVESGQLSDPEGHIDLFNKLRTNQSFNNYYKSRYIDLSNSVYSCNNMLQTLDSLTAVIDPEMTRHALRWNGTYTEWKSNVQDLRNYIQQRCSLLPSLLDTCYNLTGPYPIHFSTNPIGAGKIKINSLTISDFPWTGNYHGGIPVLISAIPDTLNSFSFDSWLTNNSPVLPSAMLANAQLNLTGPDTIIAQFRQASVWIHEFSDDENYINAFPSVFESLTNIEYFQKESGNADIVLYSTMGQPVTVVKSGDVSAGLNKFTLNLAGKNIPQGMYLLNFKSDKVNKTIRLIYTGN
jgi:hypothetical protein